VIMKLIHAVASKHQSLVSSVCSEHLVTIVFMNKGYEHSPFFLVETSLCSFFVTLFDVMQQALKGAANCQQGSVLVYTTCNIH
jgi:hypothetical protein